MKTNSQQMAVSEDEYASARAELNDARLAWNAAEARLQAAQRAFMAAQCGEHFGVTRERGGAIRHHCIRRAGHPVEDGHASGSVTEQALEARR